MIFVNNISELEFYTPNPRWGCYGDALLEATDMLLQANVSNGYTGGGISVSVLVCNTAGVAMADVSIFFTWNFRNIVIGGNTYYFVNLRGNTFSPYMIANKCWTLNVIVTDNLTGVVIFNKWTQKYNIVAAAGGTIVIPTATIDGDPLPPCIIPSNPALCSSSANGFVRFTAKSDCYDAYTGDIYADSTVISSVGELFTFYRTTLLDAKFKFVPAEINITKSINCTTQKTAITEQHILTGNEVYPEWKAKELQKMMLTGHKFVNGEEYQTVTQTIVQQFGKPYNCQYVYSLSIQFTGCPQWQVFGCVVDCESLATYYMIPYPYERVYDDSMSLIATSESELIVYLSSLTGTKVAQALPYVLPCPVESLIKIESSGVLPKFLYINDPIPGQRIYPKRLGINTLDLSPLCNGVTGNNQVAIPDVTGEDSFDINVPVPDVTGEESVDADQFTFQITPGTDWTIENNFTSGVSYAGEATLNLSISTTVFTAPFINLNICNIQDKEGCPTRVMMVTDTDNGNMPPASTLTINIDGTVYYSGPATSYNSMTGTYYLELFMIKYYL